MRHSRDLRAVKQAKKNRVAVDVSSFGVFDAADGAAGVKTSVMPFNQAVVVGELRRQPLPSSDVVEVQYLPTTCMMETPCSEIPASARHSMKPKEVCPAAIVLPTVA